MRPPPRVPDRAVVLHLVPEPEWASSTDPYAPASLADEGFIHCSPDETVLLAVANARYREVPGPFIALEVDVEAAAAEGAPIRWEAAAGPVPAMRGARSRLFPHVYGPLPRAAVLSERRAIRAPDGTFTGFEPQGRTDGRARAGGATACSTRFAVTPDSAAQRDRAAGGPTTRTRRRACHRAVTPGTDPPV